MKLGKLRPNQQSARTAGWNCISKEDYVQSEEPWEVMAVIGVYEVARHQKALLLNK